MTDIIKEDQHTRLMRSDFHFEVPLSQIAQTPIDVRDHARMLQWKDQSITHHRVHDLSLIVPEGSLFIVNNSKVIASRVKGKLRSGGAVEVFLLEPVGNAADGEDWHALGKPMRKLKQGTLIDCGHDLTMTVVGQPRLDSVGPEPFQVALSLHGEDLLKWLDQFGEIPLPPYIDRKINSQATKKQDRERYQTVYAQPTGSVAAPTAGLHFTPQIVEKLQNKKCAFAHVTLHVGAGTFLPVKADDPNDHLMHEERFMVPRSTLDAIYRAKEENRPIIVVGTTALRSLEGFAHLAQQRSTDKMALTDQWLRTNIFIRPNTSVDRFKPWCANALMTNFHQPESTLLMLVSALVGYDNIKSIYKNAVDENYRFFSYGDSSLLWL